MDIVFTADNNSEIYVLPIIPYDVDLSNPSKNEEFDTINSGPINIIGDAGLRSLSISSFFPTNDYSWIKAGSESDGWTYVDFLKTYKSSKSPIRVVVSDDDGIEVVNMECTIEDFTYGLKRNGDIRYSLSLKEYV
jgi:hypothetical protein